VSGGIIRGGGAGAPPPHTPIPYESIKDWGAFSQSNAIALAPLVEERKRAYTRG
jgi:hypothetical protein